MAKKLLFLLTFLGIILFYGESKYMVYNTSQGIVTGKLNVHLVAHTHDDVGWLKTVDQYYVGSNNSIQGACVQNVLDSVVQALLADKNRKFIYVEQAFFQRWWRDQSEAIQDIVKKLISSGQLEFINGGMCMHDEAATHYIDMIDQTTLGHRFIKDEFGVTPRVGWQIDPFGHSAVQAYLLGAEVGFDSLFFGRIDYQDRAKRKTEKSLEVIWQGSKSLGSSAQIFAGAFPENYEPPSGFYFEVNDKSPIVQDNMDLFDYNVKDRVNDFVAAAFSQANITRTNHIMWTMGTDFKYQYAHTWFRQLDKLIHYVNKDGRVNALYSTPSIYTDAKYAANESWPFKTDDFFPYADKTNSYWTGYFTSRPAIKRYVRLMSGYYLAARQLEFFRGRSNLGPNTDSLADALAIAEHHDAVTGTEQQHVANDYSKRLSIGYKEAEELVSSSLSCLVESTFPTRCQNPVTKFQQCPLLNISYCPASEVELTQGKNLVIVVYNSLGWKRNEVIRIPVIDDNVSVHDSKGIEIESQLLPQAEAFDALRNYYVKAYLGETPPKTPKYWLAFTVSVPPFGFSTYIVSTAKRTGSTKSTVYTYPSTEKSRFDVGNGNLKLTFSTDQGKHVNYVNSRSLVEEQVEQRYLYYSGYNGSQQKDPQNSGAYIFRPNGTYNLNRERQVPLTVLRGPVLDEVHQQVNPWIYQITRLQKGKEHVEVEFIVGPIPIEDGIGKEVATQVSTTMDSNKTFYTDSNGRDFIKSKRTSNPFEILLPSPLSEAAGDTPLHRIGWCDSSSRIDFCFFLSSGSASASSSLPELQKFAIRILSLTCSSSGCERNWSAFEMVHTKRRNRLKQKTMNDVVYVMANSRLAKKKQVRNKKTLDINFEDIPSDDEWIMQEEDENIEGIGLEDEDMVQGQEGEYVPIDVPFEDEVRCEDIMEDYENFNFQDLFD